MKDDELAVLLGSPQGQKFLQWLEAECDVKYSASQDGLKCALDNAVMIGRKSLLDVIKTKLRKGQKNDG